MERIIVLLESGRVIHSRNFGKSWEKLESYMLHRQGTETPFIFAMQQSPLDPNVLLFLDKNLAHLITRNCGESYEGWAPRLTNLMFHPAENATLAGLDGAHTLWLSRDWGGSWRNISANVGEFAFAKYSDNAYFSAPDRIIATVGTSAPGAKPTQDLLFSDDYFATSEQILSDVDFFRLTKCCVYARQSDRAMGVTDAFGWFYLFYGLTIEGAEARSFADFNILDTEELFNTFATVSRQRGGREAHDLLKSDPFGADFKLVLKDLVCNRELAECDFLPLRSLEGSLLVNRFDRSFLDAVSDLPLSRRKRFDELGGLDNLADYRVTLLSRDFGESFARIAPPHVDERGRPLLCEGECFLNLHLQSSAREALLPKSSPRAPGLVLAAGSVSAFLQERPSLEERHEGLFLSMDGGLAWRMVARGRFLFEVLDGGNTLLAARRDARVAEVLYSLDAGASWRNMTIADEPVEVVALTVRGQSHLKKTLVVARLSAGAGERHQLVTLDFSGVNERVCVHAPRLGQEGDYEAWTPAGTGAEGCLNGREVSYVRKAPGRQCDNPEDFVLAFEKRFCPCTEADFHCNFGFKRTADGGCVEDPRFAEARAAFVARCRGSYVVPSPYKRNYESYCVGGIEHYDEVRACPASTSLLMRLARSVLKWGLAAAALALLGAALQRHASLAALANLPGLAAAMGRLSALSRGCVERAKGQREMTRLRGEKPFEGRAGGDSLFDDEDDPHSSIEVQIGR